MRIISGGQTGADRAALDFAIAHNFDHGGWCPRGRRAEDGMIPAVYRLLETSETNYAIRTARNVADADATVIFSMSPDVRGGTALTAQLTGDYQKPLLHLDASLTDAEAASRLRQFLKSHAVRVLNIAGPRASQEPTVGTFVHSVLVKALLPRLVNRPASGKDPTS